MLELIFPLALYIFPLLLVIPLVRWNRFVRISLILGFFVSSMIGEIVYVLVLFPGGNWTLMLTYYPFALFPLGLWAAVFCAAWAIVVHSRALRGTDLRVLVCLGIILGSAVGGGFLVFVWWTAVLTGAGADYGEGILPYVIAGAVSGGFSGGALPLLLLWTNRRGSFGG